MFDAFEITDEGDGIVRVEAYTRFVPDGEAGEEVRVEVTDVKPRFAFAEIREA